MKILITGGKGQLGKELTLFLQEKNYEIFSFSSKEFDITNLDFCLKVVKDLKPEIIINCGAYTLVDECEKNVEKAFKVNSIGAKNMAIISNRLDIKLFHISTDYVFDGEKENSYNEYDNPNPINIYGKSKLFGETFVKEHTPYFFILRVSGVYGKYGKNFVKTIIQLAREKEVLKVVNDQRVTPTSTYEIAKNIYNLIETENFGLYHATCEGECTWYEFAKSIFEYMDIKVNIIPCTTEEFPRPAKRPRNSVLENFNLKLIGYNTFSHWKDSLLRFLKDF